MKKDNEVIMSFMKGMKEEIKMDIKKVDLKIEGVKSEMKEHNADTATIASRLEGHMVEHEKGKLDYKKMWVTALVPLVIVVAQLIWG